MFLFVDPLAPFSKITHELLRLLREQYPDGSLALSTSGTTVVQIPAEDEEAIISYAVLKNPKDPASGWRNLGILGDETPANKGLKDNLAVAFALHSSEEVAEEELFVVDFPELEDPETGDQVE